MRIARIGEAGKERPAVETEDGKGVYVDDLISDWNATEIASGAVQRIRQENLENRALIDLAELRRGSPLAGTSKIICVGLNYSDHAAETGMTIPDEPVVFMKAPNALCGPDDPVFVPPGASKLDYEAELAVVVSEPALCLSDPREAKGKILGYAISQDISERAWQLAGGGQWVKGKSFPSFNPFGPVIVTADAFDPSDVSLSCRVNGELRQHGNTGDMIFSPEYVVWYLSQFMELLPGDIINTGTPAGVGIASDPTGFLNSGDEVETEIAGIGRMTSKLVDHWRGRPDVSGRGEWQ
jgi:2-keto-4-pentenoate hydratase/2-oxohepta-3-ene-1,7-dioic acid hydratase in catechol pathway